MDVNNNNKELTPAEAKRLEEQRKRAKRERAAEKRRKKTRDKLRLQGLEHTRYCPHPKAPKSA